MPNETLVQDLLDELFDIASQPDRGGSPPVEIWLLGNIHLALAALLSKDRLSDVLKQIFDTSDQVQRVWRDPKARAIVLAPIGDVDLLPITDCTQLPLTERHELFRQFGLKLSWGKEDCTDVEYINPNHNSSPRNVFRANTGRAAIGIFSSQYRDYMKDIQSETSN